MPESLSELPEQSNLLPAERSVPDGPREANKLIHEAQSMKGEVQTKSNMEKKI